jgi:antitoxin MazE
MFGVALKKRTPSLPSARSGRYTHTVVTLGKRCVETKIIAIGNSKGVRLPKAVLEEARLSRGDTVKLEARGRAILITPKRKHPRAGWVQAFRRARSRRVKENLWGEIPLDEGWDN